MQSPKASRIMSEPLQVLLDTHAFLWWVSEEKKLPRKAAQIISDYRNTIYLSHASVWEMAIKAALGKLNLPEPAGSFAQKQCKANQFQLLPISLEAIARIETLPRHHKDPFDRILVAQCLEKNMATISADTVLAKYRVSRIWS
jgi:PIN domain nuclease of toxin-antitoxin system